MRRGKDLTDIEEIGTAILVFLRVLAFIIGVALLVSGFADFGGLGNSDFVVALSSGPIAFVKIVVGVILIILAIVPAAIGVIIQWIIKT
jgi:hypothetical protein